MNIVALTQARTGSTRFPGKVLKTINGKTLLALHIQRVLKSRRISKLIVATTVSKEDNVISEIASQCGISSHFGSVNDVLDRFYQALQGESPDYVVRLTSDCPLIDAELIDKVIDWTITHQLDYCSNTLDPKYPDGQDIEVFKFSALERAWKEARMPSEREHVTPYIWKNSSYKGGTLFKSDNFEESTSYGHLRMTVDEVADFELIKILITGLGDDRTWLEYARYIESNDAVRALNARINRNEGYDISLNKDN